MALCKQNNFNNYEFNSFSIFSTIGIQTFTYKSFIDLSQCLIHFLIKYSLKRETFQNKAMFVLMEIFANLHKSESKSFLV
jgi:hypothetical protein